jgi:hypothetical protein
MTKNERRLFSKMCKLRHYAAHTLLAEFAFLDGAQRGL